MDSQANGSGRVKTAQRVFDIIELASDVGGVRTREVSNELGIAQSTAHGYLMTLEALGWLVRDDARFRLGSVFLRYERAARDRLDLLERIEPTLSWCAEETAETVWYVGEEQGRAIYLSKREGHRASRTNGAVGKRAPLHATACGKVILADQPDARIEEIDLPRYTAETITDRDALRAEIREVRNRDIAYNDGETTDRLRAVACPVRSGDAVIGAISVCGPERRIGDNASRTELRTLLHGAANEIELNLSDARF